MKKLLFILGSELYAEKQIQDAVAIAQTGVYDEVFVPTPDGNSALYGKILYSPQLTTFRCGTMIVPVSILTKLKDHYHTTSKDIHLTFCDLIDTWRCEVNRTAARDAGFECEVLKRGKMIRKAIPAYEYPVKG
jgi:hypothetical protein